jgi:pyridoxamine---pyruvate transaminase
MTSWPRMTLASGPVDVPIETLLAMSRPVVYHYDPVFIDLFERTNEMMREVFRTQNDIVILQGEAVAGIEAAAASTIQPGTRVLNLVSGVFGKYFEDYIRRYGGEPIEIGVPYNAAIDPDDVRRMLEVEPGIEVVSVVHSETPSGTINPVREICRIAKEFGAITIVDTVSGLGSEPFSPDTDGVDIAIAGPQKCLAGVPGLSLMAISPDAWDRMEAMENPLRGSFLSLLDWKSTWIENRRFPYTPSVSTMYALEASLQQALREGLDHMVERHHASAKATRAAVKALGLELWAESEAVAGANCTAVKTPEDIEDAALRETMRNRYGVMISGGYGSLAGKLFRLGHMGMSAHPTSVIAQVGILERALLDLGHSVRIGAGVGAAIAAFDGWDESGIDLPV